jgi:hypothetical protein
MLFLVIERFRGGQAAPVYARLAERGRSMPEGLRYVGSWVEANLTRCFQVVEAEDVAAIQRWVLAWNDLVEFEIVPVVTSAEVQALFQRGSAPTSEVSDRS